MVTNESMGNVVTALRGRPVKAVDGSGLVFPGSAAAFLAEVVDGVEDEEAEDREEEEEEEEEDEIEETEEVAVPVVVVAAAAAAVGTVWVKVTVIPRSLVVVRTVRIRPAGRVVVAGS